MSYSGVQPTFGTFPSDLFTGNGSNTGFTMSSVPGNKAALLVSIDGVRQHTDTYSYSANTLTFSEAPPSGAVIEAINMGSRADVVITDGVYRKSQFTATAAQTNFNIATGYTVGFVDVYLNGIRLVVGDDFTANDGSTVILAVAAAAGDAVEVVAYGTFNVANALQKSGDTMSGNFVVSGTSTFAAPVAIANAAGNTVVFANTGAVTITSNTLTIGTATYHVANGNVGINTSTPAKALEIAGPTTTNITSGTGLEGAVVRLRSNYNWENAYSGGDFLGGVEFYSSDDSAGTGVRAAIKATSDNYYNTNSLTFYTANSNVTGINERMRINANGHVTIPYQPSFLIRKTTSQTGSGGTTIVASFDTARDNVGSYFNTSTSTFTAPVAGRYLLTALLNINRNSASYFNLLFQINGSNIGNLSSLFYSQPSWTAVTQTIIVNLSVNDAVRVVVGHDNNATLDNSGYFSGMLLG